jgi:(S)-ureidoglycine---glyoxylate transaminase
MGSGPSNPEPRVLQAMSAAPIAPDDPAFLSLLDDISALGRAVFQTAHASTLAVPGASRSGIEAVLASLIEPGDRVLVAVYGHFGELLHTLATRHGAHVERVEAPQWGQPVDVDQILDAIRLRQPKIVAIVHADTSTGILQPLAPIGAVCREAGSLLVVDAVLSLGGCAVEVDNWCLDAAIGGLQKCLGGPPGLAPLTYSERVQQVLARRTTPTHSAYLDLRRIGSAWRRPRALNTSAMSSSMLLAAREALRLVLDEGLSERWQRHREASVSLRAGSDAMGLDLFGEAAYRVPMITLVGVPAGIDEGGVRRQLLDQHGIEIMAAFGPLRGLVWRIGTMGTNARLPSVLAVLAGLEAVLASRGFQVVRGAAIDAALAAYPPGGQAAL